MAGDRGPNNQYPSNNPGDARRWPPPLGCGQEESKDADTASSVVSVGLWGSNLDTLLDELHDLTATATVPEVVERGLDNQLVQVRLGMASSLFAVLRCRDPLTAAHCLRVALTASAWCVKLDLPGDQRDLVEVAALLHDLGVIAMPDKILHKPGGLDAKEVAVVQRSRQLSVEILRSACSQPPLLDIIEHIPARYDGARRGYAVTGEDIPLGARMIAIVESFDSMTSDHAFRPAMSQEAALRELFVCAGSQFDPHLVEDFALLQSGNQAEQRRAVTSRWLHELDPETVESHWELSCGVSTPHRLIASTMFEAKLLENMHDAIIFLDDTLTVTFWNHGAERMTGISESSVSGRQWTQSLLHIRDERGRILENDDCPLAWAVASGTQSLRRLTIQGRNGRPLSVDAHVIPVLDQNKSSLGAVLLLHDASSETSLETRCQNLHEKSTKDPLTQVGNRAEFDRVHGQFVQAHLQQQRPCSLIICDLDRFKQVNDTYGHQAGDDVIKSMASVLKDSCRAGDLVARYGGEEFVMLCADCDNAAAARRAEQIRKNISRIPQPRMAGNTITASFGVTEIQPGDCPETMLRRADRALLTAKARGRNRVVQLGSGSTSLAGWPCEDELSGRFAVGGDSRLLLEQDLFTSVPIAVAVEKLRGFIADHQARLIDADGPNVHLEIVSRPECRRRRSTDRPTTFLINLRFEQCQADNDSTPPGETQDGRRADVAGMPRTKIHFSIKIKKRRDRRHSEVLRQAREMLVSFRSYLMVTDGAQLAEQVAANQSRHFWGSWLSDRLAPLENGKTQSKRSVSFWQSMIRKWKRTL